MPASVPVQYGHGGSLSHDMQQALQQPSRGRTTLSIAQALKCNRRRPRLRTERGRVLGQETHSESMREKGLYASLCAKQFKDFS